MDYHFPLVGLGFYSGYRSGYYSGWSSYYPPLYYEPAYYDYAPAYPAPGYYEVPLTTASVPLYTNGVPASVGPEELRQAIDTEPVSRRAHEEIFISRPDLPGREAPEALPEEEPDTESRREIPSPDAKRPGAANPRGDQ